MADLVLEKNIFDFTNVVTLHCEVGATINLGSFESAKALVGMEINVPTNPADITIEEVREELVDKLLDLLHDTIDDVKNYIDENHK